MRQATCILLGPVQVQNTWRCANRCGSSERRKEKTSVSQEYSPRHSRVKVQILSSIAETFFFQTNQPPVILCVVVLSIMKQRSGAARYVFASIPDGVLRVRRPMGAPARSGWLTALSVNHCSGCRSGNILDPPTLRVSSCPIIYQSFQRYFFPEWDTFYQGCFDERSAHLVPNQTRDVSITHFPGLQL